MKMNENKMEDNVIEIDWVCVGVFQCVSVCFNV